MLKNLFNKKVKSIDKEMDKIHQMGILQGRLQIVEYFIGLCSEENKEFLSALAKAQADNQSLLESMKQVIK